MSGSLASAVGSDEEHRHHGWFGSPVAPAVARAVLYYGVTRAEHLLGPIVQLEDHFTGQDHFEVDRVGGVHPRVVWFHAGQQARQFLLHLRQRRLQVKAGRNRHSPRRDAGEPEPIATYGREVAGLRRRTPVAGKVGA